MSKWNKEQLENMLEDVVNTLDLSEIAIDKHGPLGTPPAELVSLVLREKNRQIITLTNVIKNMQLPDIYKGELNTQRIKAYQLFGEKYNVSIGVIRDSFCEGADWYKELVLSQLPKIITPLV